MSNIRIGDKVVCTHANSPWFNTGQIYKVVAHPQTDAASVIASDGHYDMLSLVVSKFTKHIPPTKVTPDKVDQNE